MPGQIDGLLNFIYRRRTLDDELRRTADLAQRASIQARLDALRDERASFRREVKRDAEAGDEEAIALKQAAQDLREDD